MDKQSRREKHKRNQIQKNKHKPAHIKEKLKETKETNVSTEAEEDQSRDPSTEKLEEFSGRKIVNNWDKYEERVEEREYGDRLRGADYSEILQLGNGGASFRFKEEQIWDEELMNGPKTNEFFAIDINDLNNAILCIPLPRRLLVDAEAFPRKLANKMEKTAQQNYAQYIQGKLKTEQIIREIFLSNEQEKLQQEIDQDQEPIKIDQDQDPNEIETPQLLLPKKDDVSTLENDLNNLLDPKTDPKQPSVKTPKENESSKNAQESKPIQLFTETKTEKLEDWLDTLLDAD